VRDWLRSHLSDPINLDKLGGGRRSAQLETHFRVFLSDCNERCAYERLQGAPPFCRPITRELVETPPETLRGTRFARDGSIHEIDDKALRLTWEAMPIVFAITPR
jgi:hypothetical protein